MSNRVIASMQDKGDTVQVSANTLKHFEKIEYSLGPIRRPDNEEQDQPIKRCYINYGLDADDNNSYIIADIVAVYDDKTNILYTTKYPIPDEESFFLNMMKLLIMPEYNLSKSIYDNFINDKTIKPIYDEVRHQLKIQMFKEHKWLFFNQEYTGFGFVKDKENNIISTVESFKMNSHGDDIDLQLIDCVGCALDFDNIDARVEFYPEDNKQCCIVFNNLVPVADNPINTTDNESVFTYNIDGLFLYYNCIDTKTSIKYKHKSSFKNTNELVADRLTYLSEVHYETYQSAAYEDYVDDILD